MVVIAPSQTFKTEFSHNYDKRTFYSGTTLYTLYFDAVCGHRFLVILFNTTMCLEAMHSMSTLH